MAKYSGLTGTSTIPLAWYAAVVSIDSVGEQDDFKCGVRKKRLGRGNLSSWGDITAKEFNDGWPLLRQNSE